MAKVIETTGKTVEDALNKALEKLGVAAENVYYEILENPSKGFFGFGARPARIKVTLKEIKIPAPIENFAANADEKIEPVLEETKIDEVTETKFETETETATENNFETENNSETETDAETENNSEVEVAPVAENKNQFDKQSVILAAKNFLTEVFDAMKIEVEVNTIEKDSEVTLDLVGKDLGILIGKHGQTLDSLQYLTNLAANIHDSEERIYFVLDVENYRNRRATALKKLAKSVAERAIRTRQDVKLEPMSRTERKVIHTALQENSKVETHSAGEDPYRYIIVSPKKKRQ